MAKLTVCDVCAIGGKITIARYGARNTHMKDKIMVCEAHRNAASAQLKSVGMDLLKHLEFLILAENEARKLAGDKILMKLLPSEEIAIKEAKARLGVC